MAWWRHSCFSHIFSLDLIDSPIEQNYSRRFCTNKMGLWARQISASEEILTPMCRTYLHDWRVTLKNGGKVIQLLLPLLMSLFSLRTNKLNSECAVPTAKFVKITFHHTGSQNSLWKGCGGIKSLSFE